MERLCEGLTDRPVDNPIELWRNRPIGSGPLPADASVYPVGALVLDADGVVNQCRWVFRNSGIDSVNCGRPAALVDLFLQENANSFCLRAVVRPSELARTARIAGMAGSEAGEPIGVALLHSSANIIGASGSQTTSIVYGVNAVGVWAAHRLEATATHHRVKSGNVTSPYVARGAENSPLNFVIGSSSNTISSLNYEGDIALVEVCDGTGNVVDAWDFNRSDLWDGGSTGYSVKGTPFTVTNGNPIEIRVKSLVPFGLCCQ